MSYASALSQIIIEKVRKYPILFDSTHREYRNVEKKEAIWVTIANGLNEDPDTLKKKWKNLRDTFLRYKKTKDKGRKWQWASLMETFEPPLKFDVKQPSAVEYDYSYLYETSHTNTKDSNSSKELIVESSTPRTRSPYHEDSDDCCIVENHSNQSQSNADPIDTRPLERSFSSSPIYVDGKPQKSSTMTSFQTKKRKLPSGIKVSSSMESFIKILKANIQPEMDETDLLFLAHARSIKKFSKRRQAIAKMKVAQVIMEQEIQEATDNINDEENASREDIAVLSYADEDDDQTIEFFPEESKESLTFH